jgi:hypothetical protein
LERQPVFGTDTHSDSVLAFNCRITNGPKLM